jgi:hypothetical protein
MDNGAAEDVPVLHSGVVSAERSDSEPRLTSRISPVPGQARTHSRTPQSARYLGIKRSLIQIPPARPSGIMLLNGRMFPSHNALAVFDFRYQLRQGHADRDLHRTHTTADANEVIRAVPMSPPYQMANSIPGRTTASAASAAQNCGRTSLCAVPGSNVAP